MLKPTISTVAVVGVGVIGRSWVRVFAEAGCETRLYDLDPRQVERALAWLAADLKQDQADGLIDTARAAGLQARLTAHSMLDQAVAGAGYLQENGPENLSFKQGLFAQLDRHADPSAVLASSTSSLDMSAIAEALPNAARCVVAHPINPPHVIPVVEILAGERTSPETVHRARAFLASVGQKPVVLSRYVRGFLSSRLHIALLREAIDLVDRGVADVDAVDTVLRDGLGLRWALLGPFGVADTNADGGVAEYLGRYRQAYMEMRDDIGSGSSLSPELIDRLANATAARSGGATRAETRRWRDRMVRKIQRLKELDPPP